MKFRRSMATVSVWVVAGLLCAAAAFGQTAKSGGDPVPFGTNDSGSTSLSVSIKSPDQLADWQKRLTFGPGDVMLISLYGEAESARPGLVVGPDGRINYLQARDVMASELTVEELRAKLETILLKFYRPPLRVIVIPQAYRSKKYYLLGSVTQTGVFPLDQPVTIIEAIAKAQGFAVGAQRRNTIMLADLSRSFLMRRSGNGTFQKLEVNFESLFLNGDLGQNKPLAPDDYLYFPPLDLKEVYVLGDVRAPGPMPFEPGMTALGAIVSRGGFGEKAYRSKVLIIRGSLNKPQTFSFNANVVLTAKGLDVKLEPRDIIYVPKRPWAKVEELLESAISEFMRAAIITWTGLNVGPFITEPIIK